MKYALIGNQNSGKTTLFNALTGANQRVGNFPGVTIESKLGIVKNDKSIEICDLPGIYSLSPYSSEEKVTSDYLINEDVDLIINIIDITNIERNLYLTMQLLELKKPMVIALNMMDEFTASGNTLDVKKLEKCLGVRCIPIIASKNEGVDSLLEIAKEISIKKELPLIDDFCNEESPVHRAIHSLIIGISDHLKDVVPERYAITQIIEGDTSLYEKLNLSDNEKDLIEHIIKQLEMETGYDAMTSIAMMRYEYIDNTTKIAVSKKLEQTKEQIKSNKIDRILTNKYLSFPIFIVIIGIIFFLTFGDYGGGFLQGLLESGFDALNELISTNMLKAGFNQVIVSLLCDGIIAGVGSVVSFLPVVVILFMFLSFLEDSGYMARIAFIMDKPLRKIGLSGRSFVPMLIGFGCSVPAVMSSRTLVSDKERNATLALIPFMPCTAKLPIFTALTAAFFGASVFYIILFYLLSVVLGVLVIFIHHKIVKTSSASFMMELPSYRFPSLKNSLHLMWEKTKDFLHKAFTIIFVASLFIWFLSSFDYHFNYVSDINDSLLSTIGKYLVYVFYPFGIKDWRIASSIIVGLSAKEAVISTIEILFGSVQLFTDSISKLQLFSFMIFVLLYMPCFATLSVYKRETSWKKALLYMLSQTLFAFIVATLIYQVGLLFIS